MIKKINSVIACICFILLFDTLAFAHTSDTFVYNNINLDIIKGYADEIGVRTNLEFESTKDGINAYTASSYPPNLLGINGAYFKYQKDGEYPLGYYYNIALYNGVSVQPQSDIHKETYGGVGNSGRLEYVFAYDGTAIRYCTGFVIDDIVKSINNNSKTNLDSGYYNRDPQAFRDYNRNKVELSDIKWAISSYHRLSLKDDETWEIEKKEAPFYDKTYYSGTHQYMRRSALVLGKQDDVDTIWMIASREGCTLEDFRSAILQYEIYKSAYNVSFRDALLLDSAHVSRIKTDYYTTPNESLSAINPIMIYIK